MAELISIPKRGVPGAFQNVEPIHLAETSTDMEPGHEPEDYDLAARHGVAILKSELDVLEAHITAIEQALAELATERDRVRSLAQRAENLALKLRRP